MKRIGALLLLLILVPFYVQAGDLTQQAESFYREGKYAQALSTYEQALKNAPNDPFLYYNIGNCYFKMGSKGLAVASYYRAFRLNPTHSDIRHNLSLALANGGDSLVPTGMPEALHRALYALPLAELKGVLCLLGWTLCLVVGLWLFTRKASKLTLGIGILFVLCAGWFYLRYTWENEPLAVVASPVVELRSGPGKNFPASAAVQQGHLVRVLDTKDHWQEVVVRSEGLKGWIEQNALERI